MRPHEARPLAFAVLAEETDGIVRQFDELRAIQDVGERAALLKDLLRSIDRYLRLEAEVLFPVIKRLGIDLDAALERHSGIRVALEGARSQTAEPASLATLEHAFDAHRRIQAEALFPEAAHRLGEEAEGLAYELDEARGRMRGTYGV